MFRRAALAIVGRPRIFGGSNKFGSSLLGSSNHTNVKLNGGYNVYTHLPSVRYFSNELSQNWPEGIKKFLEKEQIEKPTNIQEKTLPLIMNNKDLVGIARTGSGKTLAFTIPAVMKILKSREEDQGKMEDGFGVRLATCLVLAPTRELAVQTTSVIEKFRHMGINCIPLVGGASRTDQIRSLGRQNHDVYVATPGRLMDLIETQMVDLSQIKYLVLDEADRMLDMGFEPQIRRIISKIPKSRQTVMWSATWPKEIQSLASEFMGPYEYVAVDSETLKANPNIKQIVEICKPLHKIKSLLDHLDKFREECDQPRTLVFVNTKRMAEMLLLQMMRNKIRAITIHGDRSQRQRDDAIRMFKNRMCNILIATDVAARGLDISDITHVVNFDFPNTIEDYIHRIGRTARAERKGTAVSLITENNANLAGKLIRVLKETDQPIPDELRTLSDQKHKLFSDMQDPEGRRRRPRNDFYSGGGRFSRSDRGGGRGDDSTWSGGGRQYSNDKQFNPRRVDDSQWNMDDDDDEFESESRTSRDNRGQRGYRYGGSGGNRYESEDRRRSIRGVFDDY